MLLLGMMARKGQVGKGMGGWAAVGSAGEGWGRLEKAGKVLGSTREH